MNTQNNNSQPSVAPLSQSRLLSSWELEVQVMVCEKCDWRFLTPAGELPNACPHCFQNSLTQIEQQIENLPYVSPPELVVPFQVSDPQLEQAVNQFSQGIPFSPRDLTPAALNQRMRRVFIPRWLVDADVQAAWQAEAGFDYQVVSHQERYADLGGWSTQQVKEDRIRWEPRMGQLQRHYDNVMVAALEDDDRLLQRLGKFEVDTSQSYQPESLHSAFVRLPDRSPEAAWSEAKPALQAVAAQECQQAAGANHVRQFQWQPEYQKQNWTLLLMPVFSTFYYDDDRRPQPVLVHGQTGKVYGARRASVKRAQKTSWTLLVAAVIVFLLGLLLSAVGFAIPPALAVGGILLVAALLTGLSAIIPIAVAWGYNRRSKD